MKCDRAHAPFPHGERGKWDVLRNLFFLVFFLSGGAGFEDDPARGQPDIFSEKQAITGKKTLPTVSISTIFPFFPPSRLDVEEERILRAGKEEILRHSLQKSSAREELD